MMKFLLTSLVFGILVWTAKCSSIERRDTEDDNRKANVDGFFDRLVSKLQGVFIEKGYDPMDLPDTKINFTITDFLGFRYPVDVGFEHGILENLSHLKRNGDATMDYKNGSIDIAVPLIFDSLLVYYNLVAKFMNIGPEAHVNATVKNLDVLVELEVNLNQQNVTLKNLKLKEASDINVKVKGFSLMNPFINLVAKSFASFFKSTILKIAEARAREEAQEVIASMNIFEFLGI